jgi:FkbM family methyltransferase
MKALKTIVKQGVWSIQRPFRRHDYWPMRVRSGPSVGAILQLDLRVNGAYWLGTYDRWILDQLRLERWLSPGDCAWDCGAYLGYYAAAFRNVVGNDGWVEVFEASSSNYERLAAIPHLNRWENVRIHHLAVGAQDCQIDFAGELGGSSGPATLSKSYNSTPSIESVKCTGVDEAIARYGVRTPDFIKFDLESAEEFALHNGKELFTTRRPPILLELHGDRILEAVVKFLSDYDYAAWNILQLNCPEELPITTLEAIRTRATSNTLLCLPQEIPRPS